MIFIFIFKNNFEFIKTDLTNYILIKKILEYYVNKINFLIHLHVKKVKLYQRKNKKKLWQLEGSFEHIFLGLFFPKCMY